MRGRAGVCVSPKVAGQEAWLEPMRDGMTKHRRFVWQKRGGNSKTSGSGPSGRKATPRALLARALAERTGVSLVVTARQAASVAAKATPRKIIYGTM